MKMNKVKLNSVFEWIEPTNNQKESMYQNIIKINKTTKSKKHTRINKVLKLAASFALVICLTGTTAYASGYLDKILGYFSIESNFVSWATSNDLVGSSRDIEHTAIQPRYDEIYSYDTIEEALEKHNLNIAIPKSKLLTNNLHEVSIKISNTTPNITDTNFNIDYNLSVGTVELNVDCYKFSSDTNNNLEMGISTAQHADKASSYKSENGTNFTLLETDENGTIQTVANIMINTDSKQTYLYSIIFTNASKTDIKDILDSFDMSIYRTKE